MKKKELFQPFLFTSPALDVAVYKYLQSRLPPTPQDWLQFPASVCVCVCVCVCVLVSHAQLFATPWIVAHQVLLSMELSRQEYQSRLPFFSPGDLPDLGIEPGSPALQADSLLSEPPEKPQL